MKLDNCHEITDFCLAEGEVLEKKKKTVNRPITLYQWPDLVFLSLTDATYMLHIPLR
jgi:hypothetical protein